MRAGGHLLHRSKIQGAALLVACALAGGTARAQDIAMPEPIVPAQPTQPGAPEQPSDIDLSNVVTAAAKSVTTVQEAPAIITVITAEEIRARGIKWLNEALATVPGWIDSTATGNQASTPLVRGVQQAQLLLHDGISMFDPWANIAMVGRQQPLESVKRIEIVTGPGGVLWGANSFLGIVNVISKEADDVKGLEINAGYGDGSGNAQDFRAYALFGKKFWGGRLKLFQHVSYENYLGTRFSLPVYLASSPAPQPPGPAFYSKAVDPQTDRSWMVNIDGRYSLGPVTLYYQVPLGELHPQLGIANAVLPNSTVTQFDRYAILEYKDRFFKERFGVTAKAYYTQFVRSYSIEIFPPSSLLPPAVDAQGHKLDPGGLFFSFADQRIQRTGGTLDTDVNLPGGIRALFGGELFYEGIDLSNDHFIAPSDAANLPILCPVDANNKPLPGCTRKFVNDASRLVGALYLDAQWRPWRTLTLDGGVRLQKGWGQFPYDLTPLGSAAVVWSFLPGFFLKGSYATGFRPPVFFNVASAPGGVQFGENPNLRNELSQSFQGEVNARVLRNVRKIRQLELRVDYSYTFLQNVIQIHHGLYQNSGTRAIHSVEGYAKLYLEGDHFLQASYTYLHSQASDIGVLRNVPSMWVVLGASFNLVKNTLDVNTNLSIFGAARDPNRYPTGPSPLGGDEAGAQTQVSGVTMDRLSPVALLQLGLRLRLFNDRLSASAQFYNVLNQHYYYPDPFSDVVPSVEITPTPAPGFNFFCSIGYHPTF
jgi:outer membrane receptor protein involved in Fe transport